MDKQPSPVVGIGMIGAGFVADMYLRGLEKVRGQRLVAITSRTPSKASALVERQGEGTVVSSVDKLLSMSDVDLVIIAVPQESHVEMVKAVASAGKAVICTKPLGRNSQEAAECLDAVNKAGVWHGYAETAVFSPSARKAKQLVDSGAIGRVLTFRGRDAHGSPHAFALDKKRMGGGPLRGLGCHPIALGRHFLSGSKPVSVMAWGDRLHRTDVESEDNAVALVRFEDGRLMTIEASWTHVAGLDIRREIFGSDGWIGITDTGETGVRAFAGKAGGQVIEKATISTGWITPVPEEDVAFGYHGQFEHFIRCFRENRTPLQTLEDGLIDARIIDAAYLSMESGRWETVVGEAE
jgi:predicted dehydrogenase